MTTEISDSPRSRSGRGLFPPRSCAECGGYRPRRSTRLCTKCVLAGTKARDWWRTEDTESKGGW